MDIDPEARQRLEQFMDGRRLELKLDWRDVATRAGVSIETVRLLRAGDGGARPVTMRKIDAALEWEPGSIQNILRGGEPADIFTMEERNIMRAYPEVIRAAIAGLAEREQGHRLTA